MIQYFLQITLLAIINQQLIGCKGEKGDQGFSTPTIQHSHSPLTISALYPNLTHYDTTIKTGNAFLYKHSKGTFLVTTTHILFDSPASQKSLRPSKIKCNNKELNNYCYSRFFDVAIFKIKESDFSDIKAITKSDNNNPENVKVSYLDTNSNTLKNINSLYNPSVNSTVKMGTINQALIPGSSGSTVVDSSGKLVGMICCQGDEYQNMTLVIPVETMDGIINNSDFNDNVFGVNIDINKEIYPNILTVPLNAGHLNMLPDGTDITSGELVIQSSDPDLKPFDIITKVNNQKVGASGNRIANISLQKAIGNLSYQRKRLNDAWRDKYGALPRSLKLLSSLDLDYLYVRKFNKNSENFFKSDLEIYKDTDFVEIINSSSIKISLENTYLQLQKGQSIKIENMDENISFFTIKSVSEQKKSNANASDGYSTEFTISLIDEITNIDQIQNITIYDIRSVYLNLINSKNSKYNYISNISTVNWKKENKYKILVENFIFRHWCFLILSFISNLSIGHQTIIFSNMVKDVIKRLTINNEEDLAYLVGIIYSKCVEFSGIQAANIINVFIKRVFKYKTWNNVEKYTNMDILLGNMIPGGISLLENSINLLNYSFTTNPSLPFDFENKDQLIITYAGARFIIIDYKADSNSLIVKMLSGSINKDDEFKIGKTKYTIYNSPKSELDTVDYNGDSSFNTDGLSSEYYKLKNSVGQILPKPKNADNISFEIDLCLKELDSISIKDLTDEEDLYYPSFYGLLQSYWDHAHLNLSGIMATITENDFEKLSDGSLTLIIMPPEISVWRRRRLLQGGTTGDCWICTYLFHRKMLTQEEYDTFNRFGTYAFKAHSRTMKGYWSYLNDLMEKFSKQACDEDWDHFKPWITKTLNLIQQNKMEEAYDSFCQEVYYLTEHYNADYSMFDLHQMDVYYGVFNRFSPVVKAC